MENRKLLWRVIDISHFMKKESVRAIERENANNNNLSLRSRSLSKLGKIFRFIECLLFSKNEISPKVNNLV